MSVRFNDDIEDETMRSLYASDVNKAVNGTISIDSDGFGFNVILAAEQGLVRLGYLPVALRMFDWSV